MNFHLKEWFDGAVSFGMVVQGHRPRFRNDVGGGGIGTHISILFIIKLNGHTH